MTESQAKQRWCPFVRVHVPAGLINRISSALRRIAHKARLSGNLLDAEYIEEQEADTHCIGSGCMAWRWFDGVSDDGAACDHIPTIHAPRVSEPRQGRSLTERRGFCGLAGRP